MQVHFTWASQRSAVMAAIIGAGPAAIQAQDNPQFAVAQRFIAECVIQGGDKKSCATRFFDDCVTQGKGTALANLQCYDALARYWDQEMNQTYQTLMKQAKPPLREAVRKGQHTWTAWRDERCQPWSRIDGSMNRVFGASCRADTIQSRYNDLDELLKAEGH